MEKKWNVNRIAKLALGSVAAATLFANTVLAAPPAHGHNGPCVRVIQACDAAGYHRDGKNKGTGLFDDCFRPLRAGQAVKGVSVSAADLQACRKQPMKRHPARNHAAQSK